MVYNAARLDQELGRRSTPFIDITAFDSLLHYTAADGRCERCRGSV